MGVTHSWIGSILVAQFDGELRAVDLARHSHLVYAGNNLSRIRALVADFSAITDIRLDAADVAELATINKDILIMRDSSRRGLPLAVVTTDDRIRRLVDVHVESHLPDLYTIRIFSDPASARIWVLSQPRLGLDDEVAVG